MPGKMKMPPDGSLVYPAAAITMILLTLPWLLPIGIAASMVANSGVFFPDLQDRLYGGAVRPQDQDQRRDGEEMRRAKIKIGEAFKQTPRQRMTARRSG